MLTLSPTSNITSRMFVDLIQYISGKWTSWNGHSVKVGDFGQINQETGELAVQGNIYDPDTNIYRDVDGDIRTLVKGHPPIVGNEEKDVYICSIMGDQIDIKKELYCSVPGLADASTKGQFLFSPARGAVLMMARPRSSCIPPGTFLEQLAKVEALKDMYLVTQVSTCPAFAFYLSNKSDDHDHDVCLALLGSAPTWWCSETDGLFRTEQSFNGQGDYTPLYTLKKIRTRRRVYRNDSNESESDYPWTDFFSVPWEPLDEDGNEVPIVLWESGSSGSNSDSDSE